MAVLFCFVDGAYQLLNPRADGYASLKLNRLLGIMQGRIKDLWA